MKYGVTPQGFIRKDFSAILGEMKAEAVLRFGSGIDLSDFSPLLPMLELMSYSFARQWEAVENIYYANFLSTSSGVNLDRLVGLGSIVRKSELPSVATVEFWGDADIVIPVGTIVSTQNDVVLFATNKTVRTDASGKTSVDATCTTSGKIGNVGENQITKIKNPIIGIKTVTNKSAVTTGRERETDADLIARYNETGFAKGGTVAGITATVEKVKGVVSVVVFENSENKTDENGVPYRSIEILAEGGSDNEIAKAILASKPAGVSTFGGVAVDAIDSIGNKHKVKFSRPQKIEIEVEYTVTKNARYVTSIDNEIKDLAYKYSLSLKAGDDIHLWRYIAILPEYNGLDHVEVKAKRKTDVKFTSDILILHSREIGSLNKMDIKVIVK